MAWLAGIFIANRPCTFLWPNNKRPSPGRYSLPRLMLPCVLRLSNIGVMLPTETLSREDASMTQTCIGWTLSDSSSESRQSVSAGPVSDKTQAALQVEVRLAIIVIVDHKV